MRFLAALCAATALSAAPAFAEPAAVSAPAAAQTLTIERVFASPSLNGAVPRGVKL